MITGNFFYFVKKGKEFREMIKSFDPETGIYHLGNGDSFESRYITQTDSELNRVYVHDLGWK